MPDILVSVAIGLSIAVPLCIATEFGKQALFGWIIVPFLVIWFSSAHINRPVTEYYVQSHKVDNVDCALVCGKVYNLNERLRRSFKDGESLLVKEYATYYFGIHFSSDNIRFVTKTSENAELN